MGLALTRRGGEAIVLSRDGETLARVVLHNDTPVNVKLLIEAPADVKIMREELLERP